MGHDDGATMRAKVVLNSSLASAPVSAGLLERTRVFPDNHDVVETHGVCEEVNTPTSVIAVDGGGGGKCEIKVARRDGVVVRNSRQVVATEYERSNALEVFEATSHASECEVDVSRIFFCV